MTDPHPALARLDQWFRDRPTRQGLLAREELGRPHPDDAALRERLITQLRTDTRPDGSVGGAFLPTAWRANELLDLGYGGDEPGTRRLVNWLLSLEGKPGAFGEGCTPERHKRRLCEHFAAGFFAPTPPNQRLVPITLPDGKVFRREPAARFAVSCVALRAVLRAGVEQRPLVQQHVASLLRMQEVWEDWGGYFPPDVLASAIAALSAAGPGHRAALGRLTAVFERHQNPDGTWPHADLFHTLHALVLARTDEARAALRRAAPALVALQRDDGTFGPTAREERALIGLRALLLAAEDVLEPVGP